jgi:hypothetical protein
MDDGAPALAADRRARMTPMVYGIGRADVAPGRFHAEKETHG